MNSDESWRARNSGDGRRNLQHMGGSGREGSGAVHHVHGGQKSDGLLAEKGMDESGHGSAGLEEDLYWLSSVQVNNLFNLFKERE